MAKFATGLFLGAAAGTVYALLTAKQSGPKRQAQISAYLDSLTTATTDVQHALTRFKAATTDLKHELDDTLKPAMADIQAAAADFEFQAQPHVQQITQSLDHLEAAAPTELKTPPEL
ncbi:YtxH domain-containing protein [Lacticaseibacillus baoqingensis]|uniref:YtxH domain-containing protein n=1 Tax=Lacticaseibacillus baoqingensis TaxID=2486013 RepID=A0ABW4E4V7_9LACO|nr:YtxH domain-containing protein [Lacticaseibacillus baoqingensis]